jgi:hypothetical protein
MQGDRFRNAGLLGFIEPRLIVDLLLPIATKIDE